jgi:hypothetical protein
VHYGEDDDEDNIIRFDTVADMIKAGWDLD